MRALKTKFPCKRCGAPAEVERLREAPFAICEPCASRNRALWLIDNRHKNGRRKTLEANTAETNEALVSGWCEGLAEHLRAIGASMDALANLKPAERRKQALAAKAWLQWARRQMRTLERPVGHVIKETTFPVVDGGLGVEDAPAVRPADVKISLTLVRSDP